MRVIAKSTINAYCECYPDAAEALRAWLAQIEGGKFPNFPAFKKAFRAPDWVKGGFIVFNINGNKYRLIVQVDLQRQLAFVKWFGTHKAYDKIKVTEVKHENPPC